MSGNNLTHEEDTVTGLRDSQVLLCHFGNMCRVSLGCEEEVGTGFQPSQATVQVRTGNVLA
jgi:hypothetical protein